MSVPHELAEGTRLGPDAIHRADRYWLRVGGSTVAALVLSSLWILGARAAGADVAVPRVVALFAMLQVLFAPSPSAERDRHLTLRALVAVGAYGLVWAVLTGLGFGRP